MGECVWYKVKPTVMCDTVEIHKLWHANQLIKGSIILYFGEKYIDDLKIEESHIFCQYRKVYKFDT